MGSQIEATVLQWYRFVAVIVKILKQIKADSSTEKHSKVLLVFMNRYKILVRIIQCMTKFSSISYDMQAVCLVQTFNFDVNFLFKLDWKNSAVK